MKGVLYTLQRYAYTHVFKSIHYYYTYTSVRKESLKMFTAAYGDLVYV
jgi:hypothetical protein